MLVVSLDHARLSSSLQECLHMRVQDVCSRFTSWCVIAVIQVPLYDLRSPVGIAPNALTPLQHPTAGQQTSGLLSVSPFSYNAPSPSLMAARAFAASRSALRAKVARSGEVRSISRALACVDSHHALTKGSTECVPRSCLHRAKLLRLDWSPYHQP